MKIGRAGQGGAIAVVLALALPLVAVTWRAGGLSWPGDADWSAVRFTLIQSSLSCVFSTALAIPVARALARRRFALRGIYIALMGAPFILPVIVAVMGLIAVFGRNGLANDALAAMGFDPVSIYGLHGVVLAHVFFNLPLAVRIILQGWQDIPAERFRLAAQIGADARDIRRLLEWPMLSQVLPGVLAIIFAICLTSFAVALTLGGGPRATTVELAIYQAFRFDFDLGRAASLSLIQFVLVTIAGLAALRLARGQSMNAGLDRIVDRWDAKTPVFWVLDTAWLVIAALFLLAPLGVIILRGLNGLAFLPASVWSAAGNSLTIALGATVATVTLALAMALSRKGWVQLSGMAPLAASPLVLGTGMFLLINPWARPGDWALAVTLGVNVIMALPFALRLIAPAITQIEADYGRLADGLNMTGAARLRLLILPRLRRPLGFVAGLTAALSMGDLGVIALFATPDRITLPLAIWHLMGAYQMEAAAGATLILLVLSFGLFALFDAGGRWNAET